MRTRSRYEMKVCKTLAFILSLPLLSTPLTEALCYGEFTAELRGRQLWLGTACKSSCFGSANTGSQFPCEHVPGTVSPFAVLATCLRVSSFNDSDTAASEAARVFSVSNTLVTYFTQENCTSGDCNWSLELTEEYYSASCIDVHVADLTTAVPPIKGIRKRIWNPTYEPVNEITCEGDCHMLDSTIHEGSVVAALLLQDNSYHFHYISQNVNSITELPLCLKYAGLYQWTAVDMGPCSGEYRIFTPSQVYAVTSTEVFIVGNNSLLYSPCRNCMWYQLLLPLSVTISSFTLISSSFYALLTVNNESAAGVWLGVTGLSPLLQVYPSHNLEWLWNTTSDLNTILISARLSLDTQGYLIAVSGSDVLQLPVPLLLTHALYGYFAAQNNSALNLTSSLYLLAEHESFTLNDSPHQLLHQSEVSQICLLANVLTLAPVCGEVTRSVVEIGRTGHLQFVDNSSLPWVNCSVMDNALPNAIFLGLGGSYVFTVQLVMNPVIAAVTGRDQLEIVSTVSLPDVVQVLTERTFYAINSTISYKISFVERNTSNMQLQVPPATVLNSVDIVLQAQRVGLECVQPLSPHPQLLGRLKTTVHVGCPPGLSLVFDDVTTQSHDNQFCNPVDNISCYYFGNEFRPVMQLVDRVTGNRSTYTGPYTLHVLAGGTSRSQMKTFDSNQKIESEIWSVSSDDILSHTRNKIEWTCGMGSPCSEIIPRGGHSPEYYLHIQASNRVVGQHETYCDLTVEFTIRLHGMSMGPITTSVTLILLLVLLAAPLLSLFPVWVWRGKRGDGGGQGGGWRRGLSWGRKIANRLQQQLQELARRYQRTPPLEPHLHID